MKPINLWLPICERINAQTTSETKPNKIGRNINFHILRNFQKNGNFSKNLSIYTLT